MTTHGVTVRSFRFLRGPNLYAHMPVMHIIMDIGPYEERPSNSFPGFTERLCSWLPGLQGHKCSIGRPGGFVERLRAGRYLGHIVEHITIELQNLMGFKVAFDRARGAGEEGVYRVVIAYKEEQPARAAFEVALPLTLAAMHDEPFDAQAEIERLLSLADEYRLGPSTAAIVNAARARQIPVLRLAERGSLVQLGHGIHQKRVRATETSLTSAIAVDLCQEKPVTNRILRQVGVPVPEGRVADSPEDAWAAAQEVGLPVVVKPEAGNQGKGVSVNLSTEDMSLDSVPTAGQMVKLRTNGNLSTGGTTTDVTDQVRPDNARLAEVAAQILALDVAGIDVVCLDIARPLREQRGAIVEVNAVRVHLDPTNGQPRQVGVPIVEMLYPEGAPALIPIIAITGTNGKTTITRLVAHMYETARRLVGMTSTEGTYIGRERIIEGDCSRPQSARAVLLHPCVEVAVLETARGGIVREGLAFDRCSVGVVTNVSSDHLGLGGIETLDDLVKVKQVVVENVAPDGAAVLNADDPLVAEMAAATDAPVVYFAACARNHIVVAHCAGGGRAVFVEQGTIILATGTERVELVELSRVGFTGGGAIPFQVQNALAAVAAAWAGGLNPALIVRALTTFSSDQATVPGRFNLQEISGVQVIADYGHNRAALRALGEAAEALGKRRTVLVLTLPGDRRDEDIRASVEASLPWSDELVLYDSEGLPGRAPGELPQLLRAAAGTAVPTHVATDLDEALPLAWRLVGPGDRLVVIVEHVEGTLQRLQVLDATLDDAACGVGETENTLLAS